MSRCWFGQGEENAQECACRRKALGCAVARQMNKREFCLAEDNDCWDRTNTELFLRSDQESKARETACSLARKEVCPAPFPGASLHHHCTEVPFAFNRDKAAQWDCQQSTRDVQIHQHKRNEKTTVKNHHQQSNLQKNPNNKDIQTSEGSLPGSDRTVTTFHDSDIGYGFKVLH